MKLCATMNLLAIAFCSAFLTGRAAPDAESLVQTTLEYEGRNCQGTLMMKHVTLPGRQGSGSCKQKTAPGSTSPCKQTQHSRSSYISICEPLTSNWQAPTPGFLCRYMYEQSPDCSASTAIKQVDCFTLASPGKCWSRPVSGFSVSPEPQGAGVSAQSMRLSFDVGSVTSGQQFTGDVQPPEDSEQKVEAFASDKGSTCNTGSCTCSSITVTNGKCDGHGTKYVW